MIMFHSITTRIRACFTRLAQDRQVIACGLLFLFSILWMTCLRFYFRPLALNGIYFQEWTSEDMMQTVSILDLRDQPWQSLLFLHIQPPMLDSIRALLVQLGPNVDAAALLVRVDQGLYTVWMVLYAIAGVILYRWIFQITDHMKISLAAALLFQFHPAAIYYANFLDGTFLSAFGMLLLSYCLWKISHGWPVWLVGAAYLFLFFTRSIYQFPFMIILIVSLSLLKVPTSKILRFTALCGLVVGAFMSKQYLTFGTISNSSFTGTNCYHSLGYHPNPGTGIITDLNPGPMFNFTSIGALPTVLTRVEKMSWQKNLNHLAEFENEKQQTQECMDFLIHQPVIKTLFSYLQNFVVYLKPSSQYITPHVIVDRLPWRGVYDSIFSGGVLMGLLTAAGAFWLVRHTQLHLPGAAALLLPVFFTFLACTLFEKGENMRFKFFIEPVFYVFLVVQAIHFGDWIRAALHGYMKTRTDTVSR